MSNKVAEARCRCGAVTLEMSARPILTTVCHCSNCREAGRILEALPGAAPVLDESGGVPYVLFRKDSVRCTGGRQNLREHRLKESSPTRRVVAVCCNTFMFLDFTKGHWLSVCSDRLDDAGMIARAPVQDRQSVMFVLRLLAAWVRMGFRSPKIDYVEGGLDDVRG